MHSLLLLSTCCPPTREQNRTGPNTQKTVWITMVPGCDLLHYTEQKPKYSSSLQVLLNYIFFLISVLHYLHKFLRVSL